MADTATPQANFSELLVDLLNELHALDPEAVQELLLRRVGVPAGVTKTPVSCIVVGTSTKTSALGVLNGALDQAGLPRVAMVMNTSDKVEAFTIIKPRKAS